MSKSNAVEHSFDVLASESPLWFRVLLLCGTLCSNGLLLRESDFKEHFGFYQDIGSEHSIDVLMRSSLGFKVAHIRRAATSFSSQNFREKGNSPIADGILDSILESLKKDRIDVGVRLKEAMSMNQGHLSVHFNL
jgi:hypothetical protein